MDRTYYAINKLPTSMTAEEAARWNDGKFTEADRHAVFINVRVGQAGRYVSIAEAMQDEELRAKLTDAKAEPWTWGVALAPRRGAGGEFSTPRNPTMKWQVIFRCLENVYAKQNIILQFLDRWRGTQIDSNPQSDSRPMMHVIVLEFNSLQDAAGFCIENKDRFEKWSDIPSDDWWFEIRGQGKFGLPAA